PIMNFGLELSPPASGGSLAGFAFPDKFSPPRHPAARGFFAWANRARPHGDKMKSTDDRPLTAEETCALCNISRATLDRHIKAGRGLARYLINGREFRILRSEALRWKRSRFAPPASATASDGDTE